MDVEGFRPQASDLAYPQKLQEYWARRFSTEGSEAGTHQSSKEEDCKGQQQRLSTEGQQQHQQQQQMPPVYATWFPTLHVALTLLAKLYRAVEAQVFQAMAQQVGDIIEERDGVCSSVWGAGEKSVFFLSVGAEKAWTMSVPSLLHLVISPSSPAPLDH